MNNINLTILTGSKGIVTLDPLLPLLLELKNNVDNSLNIKVFVPNIIDYEYLLSNTDVINLLNDIQATIEPLYNGNKLSCIGKHFKFFIKGMFRKNIIINGRKDIFLKHKFFIFLLKLFSKTTEISSVCDVLPHKNMIELFATDKLTIKCKDYIISSIDLKDLNRVFYGAEDLLEEKLINIGYLQSSSIWLDYINQKVIEKKYQNHCLVLVPYLGGVRSKAFENNTPPVELFKNTLQVLERFPDLQVLFRAHPKTNIEEMHKLISMSAIKKYSITIEHPLILAKNALFVLANEWSTILCHVGFYKNVPTIEYNDRPDWAPLDTFSDILVENKDELYFKLKSIVCGEYIMQNLKDSHSINYPQSKMNFSDIFKNQI